MHIRWQEYISIPTNTDQEQLGSSSANRPQEGTGRGWWSPPFPVLQHPALLSRQWAPAAAPGPADTQELGESREKSTSQRFLGVMTTLAWRSPSGGTGIWLESEWVSELILSKCQLGKNYLSFKIKKPTEVQHFVKLRGYKLAASSVYQKVEIMWLLLKMLV